MTAGVDRAPRLIVLAAAHGDLDALFAISSAGAVSWTRQQFLEELERAWSRIDVVKRDGVGPPLAFVCYWLVSDEVHVLNVATAPDELRQGHATRLLEHVARVGRQRAAREVTLEVRRSNTAAIALYRKLGYRLVGVRPAYYVAEREDALLMTLDL